MSLRSRYTVSNGQRAQTPVENRDPSVSDGVDVCLHGWMPGLEKVQLTKALRAGGLDLSEASERTGDVLNGDVVHVHLRQFATIDAARTALRRIGVETVRPPSGSN